MKVTSLKLGCAVVFIAASSFAAGAQDASGPWTGFYAGGQVGYGYGVSPTQFLDVAGEPGTEIEKIYDITPNAGPGGTADCAPGSTAACTYARDGEFSGSIDSDPTGITGGVHFGVNYQASAIVFGFEADYDASDVEGSGVGLIAAKDGTLRPGQTLDTTPQYLRVNTSIDNLASVRGRVGYAAGPLLLYGTAGFAWMSYEGSATSPEGEADPRDGDPENDSGTYRWNSDTSGWVAGGGLEYLVTDNLSIRVEGMHYDFGSLTFGHQGDLEDFDEEAGNIEGIYGRHDVSVNQVRIGASYRLN